MSDVKIVQCFGVRKRPHKQDKQCRRRFMWTALGTGKSHFGRRGTQACPHCGTLPNLAHPLNRYLGGDITEDQAMEMMPEYLESLKKEQDKK